VEGIYNFKNFKFEFPPSLHPFYTQISTYIKFILSKILKGKILADDCDFF